MASSPIPSWQIDGETMETVTDFILGGSKITADEIKRCLLLGRKVMTNLDSTLKSRDITLPTKLCLVKAVVFPVLMYGCESWTIKKADSEEVMLLNCGVGEDSWASLARISNQFILKEISPEYSLEGLMLKLCPPDAKNWLIGQDPDAGKDWRQEEKGTTEDEMVGWHHRLNGHELE